MDVSGIAKLATSMAETGNRTEVGYAMLKKAQDVQASTAAQLISGLEAAAPAQNLPAHLGKNINTTA